MRDSQVRAKTNLKQELESVFEECISHIAHAVKEYRRDVRDAIDQLKEHLDTDEKTIH